MSGDDTIAAIATAPGPAGISIVRISGPLAFDAARKICGIDPGGKRLEARYATFSNPATGEKTDDGIVLFFKSPNSYTGEDVAELQGHGGRLPASRLLCAALAAGARMAEPGEFTRRAFLNGKIDLARAEAVMDFIGAASDRAAAAAREQLDGRLSGEVNALFDAIVAIEADVEHLLDFDEGEIPPDFNLAAARRCRETMNAAARLLASWRQGRFLREGALVVICGKPNVGKSSLLNAILGRNRAIVSPIAGTTRDSIEEPVVISGIPVRLVDTAGLRAAGDVIEAEGVSRAEELVSRADVVVEVADATDPAATFSASAANRIKVFNKADLGEGGALREEDALLLSAKTGDGVETLLAEIAGHLDDSGGENAAPGVSERHRECLAETRQALEEAAQALELGDEGLVVAAEKLAQAAQATGRVTGRVWSDELLDVVFGKFCVGK